MRRQWNATTGMWQLGREKELEILQRHSETCLRGARQRGRRDEVNRRARAASQLAGVARLHPNSSKCYPFKGVGKVHSQQPFYQTTNALKAFRKEIVGISCANASARARGSSVGEL